MHFKKPQLKCIKTNSLLFVGCALSLFSCQEKETAEETKPNIIYILADDLGYGELGCYGQEKIETPNIDKLAQEGIRFTDHYVGSPVSAPSRCMLLTGKHPGKAQIRGNDEWASRGDVWSYHAMLADSTLEGQRPMKPGTETLATMLKKADYTTGIVGKWGLGAPHTHGTPTQMGFDFFVGYNCQRQAHTYYPVHLYKNDVRIYLDNDTVAPHTGFDQGADPYDMDSYKKFNLTTYSPDLMFDELTEFIHTNNSNKTGKPFFMYWATPIPHVPLQAPQKWVDYYVNKFGDEEPYLGDTDYFPHRYPHAAYAGMISYLDEQVGLLVNQLKELGIYENTLIIFTSDNGPTYNGGADSEWFNSGGLLQEKHGRGKGFTYEGGIRVPMIASWPNKIKPHRTSNHISAFWDMMPTFCEIAGIDAPADTDGISLLPELLGEEQPAHKFLYWEFPASGGQQAVRIGKWKGIRNNINKGNMTLELYDLENDIQEVNDIAANHPNIIKKMEKIMKEERVPAEIERFKMKKLGD